MTSSAPPATAGSTSLAVGALRVLRSELLAFKRTWRGWIMSSLGTPIVFLAAMGIGLGQLVDNGSADGVGIAYVTFVASGLLAASSMQTGFDEGAWPVMAGLKWRKQYEAMVVTPVRPVDLLAGRLAWGVVNLVGNLLAFVGVAVALGAVAWGPGLAGIGPAMLTGLAFQAATTAYTASLDNEIGLTNAFRFGVMPLFLFSGTFFPISQLPRALELLAVATPLYHGVELTRKVALGADAAAVTSAMPAWVHVAYLVVMLVVGAVLAARRLTGRLYQ